MVHIGIEGADRAVAVCNVLRGYMPELLALSASSPFIEDCYTHLHSTRSQTFTKMFPRCGIPDTYDDWDDYAKFLLYLYTNRLGRRAHAAVVERPAASAVPDRRDPDLRRPARAE